MVLTNSRINNDATNMETNMNKPLNDYKIDSSKKVQRFTPPPKKFVLEHNINKWDKFLLDNKDRWD